MRVWDEGENFRQLVMNDARINETLSREELESLFDLNRQLRNVDKIFERVFRE
jgi:adenylosuccinate lyase